MKHSPLAMRPDKSWTLFLDRDGVLNNRPVNDYVRHPDDFIWLPGLPQALEKLSRVFGTIVVVTNQQGVGKALMTEDQLSKIHQRMLKEASQANGRIDRVYHCADLADSNSFYRKPAPGMGLMAKKDFPAISFRRSVMVGDTLTDMLFGKRLHMYTVLIDVTADIPRRFPRLVDFRFGSLHDFSLFLSE